MRGIYVHIPFCLQKCPYCDFYSVRFDEGAVDAYADALVRNFKAYSGVKADTVYFGGGTPSCLPVSTLGRIVNGLITRMSEAVALADAFPCHYGLRLFPTQVANRRRSVGDTFIHIHTRIVSCHTLDLTTFNLQHGILSRKCLETKQCQ